jgi:Fe-S cluster assembly protein SufD
MVAAVEKPTELLEANLGRHAGDEGAVALNGALFSDGAVVDLEPRQHVAEPIHLLHLSTGAAPAAHHVRHLVVAGSRTTATVVESYVGLGGAPTLTTSVTELLAGDGANLRHATLQRETLHGEHHGKLVVRAARDAVVTETSLSVGASRSVRVLDARLEGPGAEAQLDALLLGTATQDLALPTFVDHIAPHATSNQLVKAVLDGRAHGSFVGNVTVRADAQQTNAAQVNRNLLLSDGARMDTTPQLEIHADDVKCSHGSTIGQLSGDALFFLRSRGIAVEPAKLILTQAFAHEVIERAPPALQPTLDSLLTQWFACRKVPGVHD